MHIPIFDGLSSSISYQFEKINTQTGNIEKEMAKLAIAMWGILHIVRFRVIERDMLCPAMRIWSVP
jgi:hypothetical protein